MSHRVVLRCRALALKAAASGVPSDLIDRAASATVRRLGIVRSASTRRIDAYFWAVVRRRCVRDRGAEGFAEKLVLDAVVDDMRISGLSNARIRDELEKGWRGVVAEATFDAVASRLCA